MLNEQGRFPNNYQLMELFTELTDSGDIAGYAYQPAEERSWRFTSLVDLLLLLDTLFDIQKFPQSTHEMRSLTPDAKEKRRLLAKNRSVGLSRLRGREHPDFRVKVLYRQNATWQGTVEWVQEKKTAQFGASLELIRLIDEALNPAISDGWQDGESELLQK